MDMEKCRMVLVYANCFLLDLASSSTFLFSLSLHGQLYCRILTFEIRVGGGRRRDVNSVTGYY